MKNSRPPYLLLLAGLCALGLISSPSLHIFTYRQAELVDGNWRNGSAQAPLTRADIDQDGALEGLQFLEGEVRLLSGDRMIYSSPPEWRVEQAEFADLNGDGHTELVMLVWREFAPWPVDRLLPVGGRIGAFHDANNLSCHIILMGWREGSMREIWAGSALAEPVLAFSISDLDGAGQPELVTMDGDYSNPVSPVAKTVRIWEWNGFGFTRLEQINLPARQIFISENGDGGRGLIIATQ